MATKKGKKKVLSIHKPDERDVKDLYYLDEMIKSMIADSKLHLSGGWTWDTFLRDWYEELMKKVGHTDKERKKHLIDTFGREWYDEGKFLTVEERDQFLAMEL